MNRSAIAAYLLSGLAALAVSGCGGENPSDTATEATMSPEVEVFQKYQAAWREDRRQALLEPDGWASLIGLHWLEPGPHYVGSNADNGIRLTMGPKYLGMIEVGSGRIRLVPEQGTALLLDGEPVKGEATLRADDDPDGPSILGFDDGRGQATVIRRGDRYALRVRHADAPTRLGFKGLEYWPAALEWQVAGRFVPHPEGQTMDVANIVGTTDPVSNPGVVEFEVDGVTHRLEALDQGGNQLFLVFADLTSGHESYGAGRFLYAPMPDAQGRVVLDFNRAYNPPCAFTAYATCPLPPDSNRLGLAVTAGEKAYGR